MHKLDESDVIKPASRASSSDRSHFARRCTLHGVRELNNTSSYGVKIFWGILISAGTFAAFRGCYQIFRQYQQMPIYVSYLVRDSSARLIPDTIVCPFNRFSKQFLESHNVSHDLAEYIQLSFGMSAPYLRELHEYYFRTNLDDELSRLLISNGLRFNDFLQQASLPCGALIKYCFSSNYRGIYDCCANSSIVSTGLGTCFRIPGTLQFSSGFGFGNTIVIDVPHDRYSPSVSNLFNDGVSVKLAEQGKGIGYDLTFIPTGTHSLMPLRATLFEFMNDPPRFHCFQSVSNEYSPHVCFDQCIFKAARDICKCTHIATGGAHSSVPCRPFQLYHCLYLNTARLSELYENQTGKTIFQLCRAQCAPLCTYWEYQPTVSYADFPTSVGNVTLKDVSRERTIILDVYYERLEYAQIKHLPSRRPQEFVSNLGGQLGLWVGGSVLTLVQILIFSFQYCWKQHGHCWDPVVGTSKHKPCFSACCAKRMKCAKLPKPYECHCNRARFKTVDSWYCNGH